MDKDKRLSLIAEYKKGTKKALDRLIESDYGFVYKIADRMYSNFSATWLDGDTLRRAYEFEDVMQEALLAYCKAIEAYDVEKDHGNFVKYAELWIMGAVYDAVAYKAIDFAYSMEMETGEDKTMRIGDIIEDESIVEEDVQDEDETAIRKLVFDNLIKKYDIREQLIIRMRFGIDTDAPRTLTDVAKVMGISYETVRKIEKGVIDQLSLTRVSFKRV